MPACLLQTTCVVGTEGRSASLRANLSRGLPWAMRVPERTGRLAIVGSGPSVANRLHMLRHWDGEIWAINGAYDFLLSKGITPRGFFGVDPLPGLAEYVSNAKDETTFYIAATCDPSVLDALQGKDVVLWFPECEDSYPEGAQTVTGGTSAITRAPFLGEMLGYRDITLFGADSSFDQDRYCYQAGRYKEDSTRQTIAVDVNGAQYLTDINLMHQASQLGVIVDALGLKIESDGLIAGYINGPTYAISEDGKRLVA